MTRCSSSPGRNAVAEAARAISAVTTSPAAISCGSMWVCTGANGRAPGLVEGAVRELQPPSGHVIESEAVGPLEAREATIAPLLDGDEEVAVVGADQLHGQTQRHRSTQLERPGDHPRVACLPGARVETHDAVPVVGFHESPPGPQEQLAPPCP